MAKSAAASRVATGTSLPTLPLFAPDQQNQGEWVCNDSAYNEKQAFEWVACEIARCAAPFYFATHYCFSENNRLDDLTGLLPPTVELIPQWPHVRAFLEIWTPPRDAVVEKSRDMMISWLAMAGVLHDLCFQNNWAVMTLSRVESLVDDGGENSTTDSLHGKIRFMHERLPPFLRLPNPLVFSYLKIRHRRRHVHVTGFSATPGAGRGPKWKRAVLDEFAHVPWSEMVMASVGRACPVGKYAISTPFGKANAFYRLRQASRCVWPTVDPSEHDRHWVRLRIHWSQHPERGDQWYDHQKATQTMTDQAVAQELDISFTRSIGRRVYPAFMHERHVAGEPLAPLSQLRYEARRPLYLTCDFNPDPLVWEIFQPSNDAPQYRVIDEICKRNATWHDAVVEFIVRYGSSEALGRLCEAYPRCRFTHGAGGVLLAGEAGHLGPLVVFGDATEEKSTVYSRVKMYQQIKFELSRYGFQVLLKVAPSNPPIQHRIDVVNDTLRRNMLVVGSICEQLRKDFEEGVWDTAGKDMKQSEDDDKSGLTRSHASSALGYLLCIIHKVQTVAMITKVHKADRPKIKDLLPSFVRGW